MTKEKLLLALFYVAGAVALAAFVATKNESLMKGLTRTMDDNGDLYRFAKVRYFKVPLPEEQYPDEEIGLPRTDSVRVFMIGDSFLESCRGHKAFPVQLSASLGEPIHVAQAGDSAEYFDPLLLFRRAGITKGPPRVVILERVERYIIDDFSDPFVDVSRPPEPRLSSWELVERRWFTDAEKNYEILWTSSTVTSPLIEWWNTACFTLLGRISDQTPVYSLHPPFLFYEEDVSHEKVNGFYYPHPDSLIEDIADNIDAARMLLKERYNADLLFMAIPNAYTIYHRFVNNDAYDDYLPRLEMQLNRRGVRTIDLYRKFCESKEVVYFPTDSHWNARGAAIALQQTLEQLSGLGWKVPPQAEKGAP